MEGLRRHSRRWALAIPNHWTPEQVMAMVDLLDELRTHIGSKYQIPLLDAYREDLKPRSNDDAQQTLFADSEPF